jgi:hypothetical protein
VLLFSVVVIILLVVLVLFVFAAAGRIRIHHTTGIQLLNPNRVNRMPA